MYIDGQLFCLGIFLYFILLMWALIAESRLKECKKFLIKKLRESSNIITEIESQRKEIEEKLNELETKCKQ